MTSVAKGLPPLTEDPEEASCGHARVRRPGERWLLLLLPFAAPTGRSRGCRYRVAVGCAPPRARVVLSVAGQAAVRAEPAEVGGCNSVPVRVQALRPWRARRLPADLATALAREHLSLSVLPDQEVHQLLLMIGESADTRVRAARIRAAVAAIHARGGGHGRP